MFYGYCDTSGRWHKFCTRKDACKSYAAFLTKNNLRLRDLQAFSMKNPKFIPLSTYYSDGSKCTFNGR